MRSVAVEIRRALHRRAVRSLVAMALALCAVAGFAAYVTSANETIASMRDPDNAHPAVITNWWIAGTDQGILTIAAFFLVIGGLFGGATFAGAEWRFGTVATTLTWDPRRGRLFGSRSAAAGLLAFIISFALELIFLAAFLPAVVAHGSASGVSAGWWIGLAAAVVRISLITAAASVLAVALATIGRNTAFALVVVFAWVIVVEGVVRGLEPSLQPWLWGDNLTIVMAWGQPEGNDFTRSPALALTTLLAYTAAIAAIAAATFHRRDIAAPS